MSKQKTAIRKMPGEFKPDITAIGIDGCRTAFQGYYAEGGNTTPFGTFKGKVIGIDENRGYLIKNLFVEYCDREGTFTQGKEDHVWIYDAKPLSDANIKAGDCISFNALAYAYHRQDGTEDYGLKALSNIEIISEYSLPSDKELTVQFLESFACEVCFFSDHCYGICMNDGYRKSFIDSYMNVHGTKLSTERRIIS